jgi:cytoskeletal protein CcmA (bactofilin family)
MAFFSSRRQPEQPEPDEREAPRAAPAPIGFETVLGGNAAMEGVLSSSGNVRLDGTFSGTLHISGNILVGETAKINADIDARNISIAGAVRGNVTGNKVQILRTGRVWGDIHATALATEEGAFIDGRITMKGHAANVTEKPVTGKLPNLAEPLSERPSVTPTIAEPALPPIPEGVIVESTPAELEQQAEETAASRSDLDPTMPFPPSALKKDLPPFVPSDAEKSTDDKGEES